MARTKENPNTGALIALLAAAGAAWWAYTSGMFNGLFPAAPSAPAPGTAVGTTPPPSISTSNPINSGTQIVNTPSAPPPLGTVVTNANDAAAQVAANYAYIIPTPQISSSAAFGSYQLFQYWYTDSMGNQSLATIYLRPDVATAVNANVAANVARATSAGAAQTSISNAGYDTLNQIQSAMQAANLSGLRGMGYGNFRYRM